MSRLDEETRREAIYRALQRQGEARGSDLARQFGVSAVTIRKDLSALERRGVLIRVHGGARRTATRDEGSFSFRLADAAPQKRDIARRAVRLVHAGDTIALDSSSSAHHLAEALIHLRDLVVVTNALPAASLLLDRSDATVVLIGGPLRRSSRATMAGLDDICFDRRVDIGFFGAHSVSAEQGAGEISADEARSKQALVKLCDRIVLLADASKMHGDSPHHWCQPTGVRRLVTDAGIPPDEVDRWRALGVTVDIPQPPSSRTTP